MLRGASATVPVCRLRRCARPLEGAEMRSLALGSGFKEGKRAGRQRGRQLLQTRPSNGASVFFQGARDASAAERGWLRSQDIRDLISFRFGDNL